MPKLNLEAPGSGSTPKERMSRENAPRASRDIYIRGVPTEIWCKARQNSLASGMAFKHYVIRLLQESRPFLEQATEEAED